MRFSEEVKIHDHFQLEIKKSLVFDKNEEDNIYSIDTFFFIPSTLDVNRHTYQKEQFYGDLKTYIRFKTPVYALSQIKNGSHSPFAVLEKAYQEICESEDNFDNYVYNLKMFCAIMRSTLRDYLKFTSSQQCSQDFPLLTENFIFYTKEILSCFRELRQKLVEATVRQKVLEIHNLADEYLSLLVEKNAYRFCAKVQLRLPEKLETMKEIIAREFNWRKQNHYGAIPATGLLGERFLVRLNSLKKYFGSVLFLDTRASREHAILQQIIFSLTAGFAMLFATSVTLYSQSRFGSMTPILILIAVVSYMLKDRMKELLRYYLTARLSKKIFDHRVHIYSDTGNNLGLAKESFLFVKESKVSSPIRTLRNKTFPSEFDYGWGDERIMLYRKWVKLYAEPLRKNFAHYPVKGVVDITRFNISRLLHHMDNPKKRVNTLENSKIKRKWVDRVYYVHMIIRYEMKKGRKLKLYRLTLTRNGLKQIEKIGQA